MRTVDLADLDSRIGPADVTYPLTDLLGTRDLALNYYELAPGDSFAYGYHAHADQEEVFYVQAGTVTFRTVEGDVAVGPDELVRFGPGEYQRGVNEGDGRVVALALGAPRESGETDIRRYCGDCDAETSQEPDFRADRAVVVLECTECGAETGRYGAA
jgi:uncharacterized cupin superfamily protein